MQRPKERPKTIAPASCHKWTNGWPMLLLMYAFTVSWCVAASNPKAYCRTNGSAICFFDELPSNYRARSRSLVRSSGRLEINHDRDAWQGDNGDW
ncbi:hypothetical protein BGZ63DRAFT_396366 [Mariannaea sp. PMI_226]|nr:hypothetical protein BGZ63DRAFT_396366 [Mariannaea sp. PMI_226]